MGRDTRERIIRAAEVLFAQHGYEGTSLRKITDEAGVNIAGVNYHFGSKEGLLIEILDRVVAPLNEERLELLDELEAQGGLDVRRILTAFLLPDLRSIQRLRARDPALTRFVSRMYSEGSELMGRVMGRQFAETQRRFYKAFADVLPERTQQEIAWRLHCIVGIVVYLFASAGGPGLPQMVGEDIDRDLQRLLEVTVPIMTAPAGEVVTSRS